jgi:hypothetical protein
MDKELLLKIKSYIEKVEMQIDGEWGDCRDLEQLIKDGVMPEIYDKVLGLLKT